MNIIFDFLLEKNLKNKTEKVKENLFCDTGTLTPNLGDYVI
jgi:hypothetical protein